MGKGMGKFKHLKINDEPSTFFAIENQLLALDRCGVYLSSFDIVAIGKSIGYDMPMKSRETNLKYLLTNSEANERLPQALEALKSYLKKRAEEYIALANNYPAMETKVKRWLQKIKSTELLIHSHLRKSPYEQR